MTKLALVAALAGMFVLGYASAKRVPEKAEAVAGKPEKRRSGKRGAVTKSMAITSQETPAQGGRSPASTEGEVSAEPAPSGNPESPSDVMAAGPGITYKGNNVEFAHLMQSCYDVENSWRRRTLEDKVIEGWFLPEGDGRIQAARAGFAASRTVAEQWIGELTIPTGDRDLNLRLRLNFTGPANEEPCWNFHELMELSGEWRTIGGRGGCGSMQFNSAAQPVVSELSYGNPEIGTLVSAMIFPLDVHGPAPFEYLLAAEGSEWRSLNFSYRPMSDAEVEEERSRVEH